MKSDSWEKMAKLTVALPRSYMDALTKRAEKQLRKPGVLARLLLIEILSADPSGDDVSVSNIDRGPQEPPA